MPKTQIQNKIKMNQTDKDFEQRIKVADAVQKYNENPTPENSSKFLVELAKLGIVWSNNTEEEKEAAKDWADLSYELFVSKDYKKAEYLVGKLGLSISKIK
ncbi:MAG: hypothetical protein HDS08_04550 [Bacteroides sp.]|nr:hypothetical protein [Bacteroides sp.]